MCLAIPGKIISIDHKTATVDFDGVERNVNLELLPGSTPGDYVLTHAGFAIQRIDRKEAEETMALLRALLEGETEAGGSPLS